MKAIQSVFILKEPQCQNTMAQCDTLLPRVHVQGVKQSVFPSVVIGTKIARSHVLGISACCSL